jgi:hypothetical protein
MAEPQPPRQHRLPAGFFTALACAVLLIGAFVLETASTPMPPAERWAALTTFGLLALVYVLQGSPELYDALGRIVRRDVRALVTLLLLLPVLYTSYSSAVDAFSLEGLLIALAFVFLPALAFWQSRRQRTPTLLDLTATLYLLLSLMFGLLPVLPLPQQGGVVDFFWLSAMPLLLLLLAARSWAGLGFTWFISRADLRNALMVALLLLFVLGGASLVAGVVQLATSFPTAINALLLAIEIYFLVALPQEILFRGVAQNGIQRFADAKLWRGPGNPSTLRQPQLLGLVGASLLFGASYISYPVAEPHNFLLVTIAGLGYGWVYQRTGKVTASAITHMLLVWGWAMFFV